MKTIVLFASALLATLEPVLARPYYTFSKVADSGDGTITNSEFPGAPAINASGVVTFRAKVPGVGVEILSGSSADGGTVTTLAQVGAQFDELGVPAINASGTVAFRATDLSAANFGIFTVPSTGGALTTIADNATNFVSSDDPAIDDAGTLAFSGAERNGAGGAKLTGLYESTAPGTRALLFDTDEPTGAFSAVGIRALENGRLLFSGTLRASGVNGTYSSAGGNPTRVAGTGYGSVNASGKIALVEPLSGFKFNVVTIEPGRGAKIFTQSAAMGLSGSPSTPAINAGGDVIFSGPVVKAGTFRYGVFRGPRSVGDRLFGTGTPLFGSKIVFVQVSKDALNDSGQIAFAYGLVNNQLGVAIATPTTPPAPPVPVVVATKGATVTAQADGSTYASFGRAQTGDFSGKIKTGAVSSTAIFGDDGRLLLKSGATGSQLIGTTPAKLGEPSGDSALVGLKPNAAAGVTTSNSTLLLTGLASGWPSLSARTGTMQTGLPSGVTIKTFGALDARGTAAFFLATLQGTGITAKNNLALCASPGDGSVRVLVKKGDLVDGKTVSLIGTLVASKGTLAEGRWRADDTDFVVRLSFADKSQAVCLIPATATGPADWTMAFASGAVSNLAALNGTTITSFGLPGFGPGGTCATLANLATATAGPTAANKVALITRRGTATPTLLARTGDTIPADADGTPLSVVKIKTLSDPIVGANGSIAFLLTATDSHLGTCIAYSANGLTWSILANTGALAPFDGAWLAFKSLVLPDGAAGRPVFLATLKPDKLENITTKNNLSLCGIDSTGLLRNLMHTGQEVVTSGGTKTIKTFTTLLPATGTIGAASGHDSTGKVSALATFTDNSQALLRITIP